MRHASRPSGLSTIGGLVIGVALLAGCTAANEQGVPSATSTGTDSAVASAPTGPTISVPTPLPVPDNFVAPDSRTVRLDPVMSKENSRRPPPPIRGGTALLQGTVFGSEGPLPGATVRLERLVGSDFGSLDLVTDSKGVWVAKDILGGRYRVRAWKQPNMAVLGAEPIFLADPGSGNLDLTTETFSAQVLQGALQVGDPRVGQVTTFKALLTQDAVDSNGIVRSVGVGDAQVQITAGEGIRIAGPALGVTNPDGSIIFGVLCLTVGQHAVALTGAGQSPTVVLPECIDPAALPATTTTTTTTATGTPATAKPRTP
jgi:hypothetical protein